MKHNWFCFSLLFEKSSLTFKLHTNFQISVELKINPKGQDFIVLYFYLLANIFQHFLLIFKDFYLFLEKEGAKEKERETSMCGCLSHAPYWEPGLNPGMCPDWELNWWSLGSQARTTSTELQQSGFSTSLTDYVKLCTCSLLHFFKNIFIEI